MTIGSRCAVRVWLLTIGGGLLLAAPCDAARLTPAIVTETEQRPTSFARAEVGGAFIFQDGDYLGGESGPWPLGDYRLAGELVDATMRAGFDNGAFHAEISAAVNDSNRDDFLLAQSSPEIRKAWFYVAPEPGEAIGSQVELNLALNWQASPGVSNAFATLSESGEAGSLEVIASLLARDDRQAVPVRVGGYYRLDLIQLVEVRDGTAFSAARLDADFSPIPSSGPPEPLLPGDYNRDGAVDAGDYTLWRDGGGGSYDFNLDGDGDAILDAGDVAVWADWFGSELSAGGLSVGVLATPEPAAGVLALFLSSTVLTRRA